MNFKFIGEAIMLRNLSQINSAFGCSELPHAMFYAFDVGLRFELGGDDVSINRPLKRFIQAFERADMVAKELFEKTPSVWLLSSSYGGARPKKKRLKPYELCGLSKSAFRYLGAEPQHDKDHIEVFGSDFYRHWDAVELEDLKQLREVLWLALGADLGVEPTVTAKTYIIDFERSIAMHPYDDRGMDVVAMEKKHLSGLYEAHKPWLLSHDLPRMKSVFEG